MALADNLVSYWSLDEASGTRADSHGSNDLTDNSTVGSTTGKVGTAASFGAGESLSHASNSDLQTGDIDWTFACWIRHPNAAGLRTFAGKGSEWNFSANIGVPRSSFGGKVLNSSFGFIGFDTWAFVAMWHDSVNNQVGLYCNSTVDTDSHSTGATAGSADFILGTGGFGDWAGLMDEVGIWKRVLSEAELDELYNSGSGRDYAYITAGSGTDYTLTADSGSFTLSGQAATLRVGRKLTAGSGSVALAGQSAALRAARVLACEAGALAVTGQPADLIYSGAEVPRPRNLRPAVCGLVDRAAVAGLVPRVGVCGS